ncbi:hypothetical protein EC968_009645, partial [Mortierella alpina]
MSARSHTQFLMEEGITDENGNFIMNPTTPTKKRRTNAQITIDLDRSLLAVFNVMKRNNLSFQEFLVAAFSSGHEDITQRVGQFYFRNGPAAIMDIWHKKLETKTHDESFAIRAIKIVGKRVRADLDNAAKAEVFKHPANSTSRATLKNFKLESLRSSLETSAPYLSLLLKKLQPKPDKKSLQTDSPCKSRTFGEPMPPVERPSWIQTRRAECDLNAASEETDADQDTEISWELDPEFSWFTEGQCEQESACKDEPDAVPRKDPRSFMVT